MSTYIFLFKKDILSATIINIGIDFEFFIGSEATVEQWIVLFRKMLSYNCNGVCKQIFMTCAHRHLFRKRAITHCLIKWMMLWMNAFTVWLWNMYPHVEGKKTLYKFLVYKRNQKSLFYIHDFSGETRLTLSIEYM